MKGLFTQLYRLSFYLIIVLAVSCKKEGIRDEHNEDLYTLRLKLDGFESSKEPFTQAIANVHKLASTSGTQQDSEGYLFFWSFNQENLSPDIRVPSNSPTVMTYNQGLTPSSFVNSNYSYGSHASGRALSITGANTFVIQMPMQHITQLTSFGFDIGSTSTGPKDFEIFYSWDGVNYELIEGLNQFSSATANAKNSFTYDLSNLENYGTNLWIKLDLKAGDRMDGPAYNPTSGAFRIDNIHLKGMYELSMSADIAKLHYFIFHQDKAEVYAIGEVDEDQWSGFEVQLPLGSYDIMLISNQSNLELILPSTMDTWSSLFASNYFINSQADIFGTVEEIHVTQNGSFSFILKRMFSQIKFEFTDSDLSMVDKIVVTPLHEPHFFAPAGSMSSNPILDQTEIEFTSGIADNKQIVFNQFLGLLTDDKHISYQLDVYSSEEIIRSMVATTSLKNNIQMVFRGELLNGVPFSQGFSVTKNESWDGELEQNF